MKKTTMPFEIKQIAFEDEAAIKDIRERVFIQEQQVPVELEWDNLDHDARHLIAIAASGEVVGTARMLANGHIGRMAILKKWRHQGAGSLLLQRMLAIAKDKAMKRVFLHAQCSAVEFYLRFGFRTEGDEFIDAGIPHRTMTHKL